MISYRKAKLLVLVRRSVLDSLPSFAVLLLAVFCGYFIGFTQGAYYLADAANKQFDCRPR